MHNDRRQSGKRDNYHSCDDDTWRTSATKIYNNNTQSAVTTNNIQVRRRSVACRGMVKHSMHFTGHTLLRHVGLPCCRLVIIVPAVGLVAHTSGVRWAGRCALATLWLMVGIHVFMTEPLRRTASLVTATLYCTFFLSSCLGASFLLITAMLIFVPVIIVIIKSSLCRLHKKKCSKYQ